MEAPEPFLPLFAPLLAVIGEGGGGGAGAILISAELAMKRPGGGNPSSLHQMASPNGKLQALFLSFWWEFVLLK